MATKIEPMKIDYAEAEDALVYIEDDAWVLEQKFDGARVYVEWNVDDGFTWHGAATFAAAKQHFPKLEAEMEAWFRDAGVSIIHLDGELIVADGTYIVFDLPALLLMSTFWAVSNNAPYRIRRRTLQRLIDHDPQTHPSIITNVMAETTEQKQWLWERIQAAGVEGAVAKRSEMIYEPGKRSKDTAKLKLVKTADLVVLDTRRTFKPDGITVHTGSAKLGYTLLKDHGETVEELGSVFICSASLIGKDLTIEPGDVVELAYLYRDDRGGLVQPRIIRKRLDKLPEECTEAQFPKYSREVV